MAEWRELGYVPDSDEDEDASSVATTRTDDHPGNSGPDHGDDLELNINDDDGRAGPESHLEKKQSSTAKDLSSGEETSEDELSLPNLVKGATHKDIGRPSDPGTSPRVPARPQQCSSQVKSHGTDVPQQVLGQPPFSSPLSSVRAISPPNDHFTILSGHVSSQLNLSQRPSHTFSQQNSQDEQVQGLEEDVAGSTVLGQLFSSSIAVDGVDIPVEIEDTTTLPKRSLRQRKAIQQHPYMLELEQYRQSLRARGIKPLKISDARRESPVEESQEYEAESQDESQNRNPHNGQRAESPSHVRAKSDSHIQLRTQWLPSATADSPRSSRISVEAGDDDDLPDVDELLHGLAHYNGPRPTKRRKVSRNPIKFKARHLQRPFASSFPDLHDENETRLPNDDTVFDVPPSPQASHATRSSSNARPSTPGFQILTDSPILNPDTPATSSEPAFLASVAASQNLSFDDPDTDARSIGEIQSDTESNAASDTEQNSNIQKVQRKIKGVLPASWLRLDFKEQSGRSGPDKRHRRDQGSPHKTHLLRGVARRVPQSRQHPPSLYVGLQDSISISDTSDTPESPKITSVPYSPKSKTTSRSLEDTIEPWAMGDIDEEDQIDIMITSGSHRQSRKRRNSGRQTKLSTLRQPKTKRRKLTGGTHRFESLSESRQLGVDDPYKNLGKAKPSTRALRQMSILDSTDLIPSVQDQAPDFLKIAARRARRKPKGGRTTPTRKFLRLSTRQDTEDAHVTLRQWRTSELSPVVETRASHMGDIRDPLAPLQVNGESVSTREPSLNARVSERSIVDNEVQPVISPQKVIDREMNRRPKSNPPKAANEFSRAAKSRLKSKRPLMKLLRGHGNKGLTSRIGTENIPRSAQLESTGARNAPRTAARHSNRLLPSESTLTAIEGRPRNQTSYNLPLVRFLQDDSPQDVADTSNDTEIIQAKNRQPNAPPPQELPNRKPKKKRPQQIDLRKAKFRQYYDDVDIDSLTSESSVSMRFSFTKSLLGVGSYDSRHAADFDMRPLERDIYFHESTFIGSGEFSDSLEFCSRDLELPVNPVSINIANRFYSWSYWSDTVANELDGIFHVIAELPENTTSLPEDVVPHGRLPDVVLEQGRRLRSILRYLSKNVFFHENVHRSSCVQRFVEMLRPMLQALTSDSNASGSLQEQRAQISVYLLGYLLVLLHQIRHIASHHVVDGSLRSEIQSYMQRISDHNLSTVLSESGCLALNRFFTRTEDRRTREAGIHECEVYVNAAVITWNLWQSFDNEKSLLSMLGGAVSGTRDMLSKTRVQDVNVMEKGWTKIFYIQPLGEFNQHGILIPGVRFKKPLEVWDSVKQLICPVLEEYLENTAGRSASFNKYCRTLFARCFYLIKGWGWRRCEGIIQTLFQFYAKRHLSHLRNEQSFGSARFLDNLAATPTLDIEPGDLCFQILLKIIGQGLQAMRHVYPEKKIQGIAWRLMPNHGRLHPKEEAISQDDLESLRNHHDLLCTLYWASPAGFRPRLDNLKNLVQPANSHHEVCVLNLKAWLRLVRFQLSTDEPVVAAEPFAIWHGEFTSQILQQHSHARNEVESNIKISSVPLHVRESTIIRNQRSAESLLLQLLAFLKDAMGSTKSLEQAQIFLTKASVLDIFSLFNSRSDRTNEVVCEALDVILAYNALCERQEQVESQNSSADESFGNVDFIAHMLEQSAVQHLNDVVHEPLRQLISNCFGADQVPNQSLLTKAIHCWTSTGKLLVEYGFKYWSSFLGDYGPDAWGSLRGTEQTRRYTCLFIAKVIESDAGSFAENKSSILKTWVASLTEPDPMLKYQHTLTSAILQTGKDDPLLVNLPFSTIAGIWDIELEDLRQRRTALISSLLSNMHASFFDATIDRPEDLQDLKQEYRGLLKHMMGAMKANYQAICQDQLDGAAYIQFLHRIIELLQQYTTEICPIDKFFTDSGSFPLPAADPTYVAGRLKGYGLQLAETRTQKQLISFFQNVSERAAADGQQEYLIEQLHAATSRASGFPSTGQANLRPFFLSVLFDTYLQVALETPTGFLLLQPVMETADQIVEDLLLDVNAFNVDTNRSTVMSVLAVMDACEKMIQAISTQRLHLISAQCLCIVADALSVVLSSAPVIDYFNRLSGLGDELEGLVLAAVKFLRRCQTMARFWVFLDSRTASHSALEMIPREQKYVQVKQFAHDELRRMLKANWVCHGDRYYVMKGSQRKEVVVDIPSVDQAKQKLRTVYWDYEKRMRKFETFRDEVDEETIARDARKGLGLGDVLL